MASRLSLFVLMVGCLLGVPLLWGAAAAEEPSSSVDFARARQLIQKLRSGQTLSAAEQSYVDQARELRSRGAAGNSQRRPAAPAPQQKTPPAKVDAPFPPPICYDLNSLPNPVAQDAAAVKPFEIMDGLYYVGNTTVSCHLLTSEEGLILIDSTFPHTVPLLLESITQLGFRPNDVKLVISTHAAIDHSGGAWYFQKAFGAKTWIHKADATGEAGVEEALCPPGTVVNLRQVQAARAYPPFQPDRLIEDEETLEWGGRKFTFRSTPLATLGTVSIEFPLKSPTGETLKAGLVGGIAPRVGDPAITSRRLKEMSGIQVWLAVHPNQNRTLEKGELLQNGATANPFVDPQGWRGFIERLTAMTGSGDRGARPNSRERMRPSDRAEMRTPAETAPMRTANSAGRLPNKNIDKLTKSWVDPDKTAPAPTQYETFFSKTINQPVSYLVYLPPGYEQDQMQRYPVLYWLHGTGGKQSRGADLAQQLDEEIRAGQTPPMIMVLVNGLRGTTLYCDTKDGKWPLETVLMQDLIPHVDANYRTIDDRRGRAIEGFSMGGFGAAHLAFKYPDKFGVVSILDPAFLIGSDPQQAPHPTFLGQVEYALDGDLKYYQENNPYKLLVANADQIRGEMAIRLVPRARGNTQGFLAKCDELHALLDQNHIAHTYDPRKDVSVHNPNVLYDALGEEGFAFYKRAFARLADRSAATGSEGN
ncbi:alpha/beta hydrolase-fold protein [Blastopirellula marina]|uniref:Metallo-beta-lactamase domain-containing protein n=1 Tax=Blastopirellula marina TaxID=124 RepID=A0A2S8GI96_9BACT|nr:alpha/beta hydrolase-fold protein [Blastopirellula marina]PQO44166.1 hypothetical protein C5Y93_19505 [Blastopirellula marina]